MHLYLCCFLFSSPVCPNKQTTTKTITAILSDSPEMAFAPNPPFPGAPLLPSQGLGLAEPQFWVGTQGAKYRRAVLFYFKAARRNGCALKIANSLPKTSHHASQRRGSHLLLLLLLRLQEGTSRGPQRSLGTGLPPPEEQRPGNGPRGEPPRAATGRGPAPGRKGSARAPPAPPAPPREREPPAEVVRRALPGVVWSPPPPLRVSGLRAAAAAAASGPGARSDVTAMAGIKALISLSFGGAVGLMFLMLGCALPIYNQYWPLFVLFFYILSPIPYCIARRLVDDTDAMSNACKELAIFLTTGIVVSAFGLPIVFARAHLIAWGACALVLTGNTVIFATILGFFLVFGSNDDFSWQQW